VDLEGDTRIAYAPGGSLQTLATGSDFLLGISGNGIIGGVTVALMATKLARGFELLHRRAIKELASNRSKSQGEETRLLSLIDQWHQSITWQ
jgi:hypothetical protein